MHSNYGIKRFKTHSRSLSNGVHFCIMADEVTDSSNRERLVVCLRWVDEIMDVQEDF